MHKRRDEVFTSAAAFPWIRSSRPRLRRDSRASVLPTPCEGCKPYPSPVRVSSAPASVCRLVHRAPACDNSQDHEYSQHHSHVVAQRRAPTCTYPYRRGNLGHIPTTRLRPILAVTAFPRRCASGKLDLARRQAVQTRRCGLQVFSRFAFCRVPKRLCAMKELPVLRICAADCEAACAALLPPPSHAIHAIPPLPQPNHNPGESQRSKLWRPTGRLTRKHARQTHSLVRREA